MKRASIKLGTLVYNSMDDKYYISDSTNSIQAEQDANYNECEQTGAKYKDENLSHFNAVEADIVIPHTSDMSSQRAYELYMQEMLNITDDDEFITSTWLEECKYVRRNEMSGWYILDASLWFRH